MELSMKPLLIDGEEMKLQIWDTAGQERYRTVTKSFYKQANGALLVFDLTSKLSFEGLADWCKLLEENAPLDISITLMGNKSDLIKDRAVSDEEIAEFLKKKGLTYFEASAKTKKNLELAFLDLAKKMKRKMFDGKSEDLERKSVRLMSNSGDPGSPEIRLKKPQQNEKKCC